MDPIKLLWILWVTACAAESSSIKSDLKELMALETLIGKTIGPELDKFHDDDEAFDNLYGVKKDFASKFAAIKKRFASDLVTASRTEDRKKLYALSSKFRQYGQETPYLTRVANDAQRIAAILEINILTAGKKAQAKIDKIDPAARTSDQSAIASDAVAELLPTNLRRDVSNAVKEAEQGIQHYHDYLNNLTG